MSPPERIHRVLLTSHYFPPHLGGIENVVQAEAGVLAAAGHDVTVLTTTPGGRPGATRSASGYTVVRVPTCNVVERRIGVPFPIIGLRAMVQAARLVRAADLVHAHDLLYMTTWLVTILARLTRTPLVLTQHVALVEHPNRLVELVQRAVHAAVGRAVVRQARRIIHVNGAVADFLCQLGATCEQLILLPNGVDTARFYPAEPTTRADLRATLGLPPGEVLALFVGRFVPKKGFETVLRSVGDTYTIVLAGGPEPPGWTDRKGLLQVGVHPPERIAELYRACDIFVLPSVSEGFPLTIQEAMATGLPVVTTDDPGYRVYQLDPEMVAFVQPDVNSVRAELARLADDANLRRRMGGYSLGVARTRFSKDEHRRGLERIYAAAAAQEVSTHVPA